MREIHTRKRNSIKSLIVNHIYENIKLYVIMITIFVIGIIAGVIFINNTNETQNTEIKGYINSFISTLKNDSHIDKMLLMKNSIKDNLILILSMWFIGSTVIGLPVVLGIVIFRGFCIGYTVSTIIAVLGVQKGILFLFTTVFLQNIIFIPVIICMSVSCIKLGKSILKDKIKENIKIEIVRHTLISIMLLLCLIIASLVEVYISSNLLTTCIKLF